MASRGGRKFLEPALAKLKGSEEASLFGTKMTYSQYTSAMDELRRKLDQAKTSIDPYFEEKRTEKLWTDITSRTDPYKFSSNVIQRYNGGQNVTNAWLKFYEIVSYFDLLPANSQRDAFFNAELPGAGICAINHYSHCRNVDLGWLASSYDPDAKSDITEPLDDRFGLLANYPDNWTIRKPLLQDPSQVQTGDMTDIKMIYDLAQKYSGVIDFYTSDAGIDASSDYNKQESLNTTLHAGCALQGLLLLKPGGNLFLKQYTYFEPLTVRLLSEYANCFESFYLFKPLSSRPQNSEIYLVGMGFRGISDPAVKNTIKLCQLVLTDFSAAEKLEAPIAADFDQLYNFAKTVFEAQILSIKEKIELVDQCLSGKKNLSQISSEYDKKRKQISGNWIQQQKICILHKDAKLNTKK